MIMVSNWHFVLSPVLILMGTAHVEACEMPPYPSPEYPAYPSHGDLRLCASGLVMIYMGPDGTNIEHRWGTFSGSNYSSHMDVADTLCQQLGYDDGEIDRKNASEEVKDYPVWISDVICPSRKPRHILRCNHKLHTTNFNHEDDWYLKCSSSSTRLESGYEANTYHGQVALIPPNGVVNFNYSQSFGVVTVREKEKFWKFIWNDSSLFSLNDADTVCRAMGYTHVVKNSVMTAKQHTTAYGANYSFDINSLAAHPASRINCLESSQCIGCCGNLFSQAKFLATDDENAIVVQCSFYESDFHNPLVSGGYKEICEVVNDEGSIKGEQICPTGEPEKMFSQSAFAGAVAPLSILLIAAIVLVLSFVGRIIWKKYIWWHRGYTDIEIENGDRNGDENGNENGDENGDENCENNRERQDGGH